MYRFVCALVTGLFLIHVASVWAEPVHSLRVILPSEPGVVTQRAAQILAHQIAKRCDAKVSDRDDAPLSIELALDATLGYEGYRIADGPDGTLRILGNNERGLLFGVGKFLHTSRYSSEGFSPSIWRGTSAPVGQVRGVYLALHFGNYYEAASSEELQEYLEELALWGTNTLNVIFPFHQFDSFEDPAAQKALERLRRLMQTANAVGMQIALGMTNEGFRSTPKELLRTPVPDPLGRHGNFGINICPSRPEGRELLLRNFGQLLEKLREPGLEYVIYWPYDEGGCGCEKCSPWGCRGFVSLGQAWTATARKTFPKIQVIVSTWTFDTPPLGEWQGLSDALARDKSWVDFIEADAHEDYPRYPLDQGVPGGLPLLNFPEISMWGQTPWGGYGANPFPARLQQLWNQTENQLRGGFRYSEGIYEDLNKTVCSQFYWNPNQTALETVREYAAFEFSPEVVAQVVQMVEILESNHCRDQIQSSAEEAFRLAEQINAKLTPQAQRAWRWRILYLRAQIDRELFQTHGKLEGETLKKAFEELTALYHAEHVHSMPIAPPVIH